MSLSKESQHCRLCHENQPLKCFHTNTQKRKWTLAFHEARSYAFRDQSSTHRGSRAYLLKWVCQRPWRFSLQSSDDLQLQAEESQLMRTPDVALTASHSPDQSTREQYILMTMSSQPICSSNISSLSWLRIVAYRGKFCITGDETLRDVVYKKGLRSGDGFIIWHSQCQFP